MKRFQVVLISDIHYACKAELSRKKPEGAVVESKWLRPLANMFRCMWLGDHVHNNANFDRFLESIEDVDRVVANGDFSCDSAFVGLADDAAFESAQSCLEKLRERFGNRLITTIGDHELGRRSKFGGRGGISIESWQKAVDKLGLMPFWQHSLGSFELIGVTSTLLTIEAFDNQMIKAEQARWREMAELHRKEISTAFRALPSEKRVLLFCHDPAALSSLYGIEEVRCRLDQLDVTIVGHLHFRSVIFLMTLLKRFNDPLWQRFKVLPCPALGCRLWPLPGLYYRMSLDETSVLPIECSLIRIPSALRRTC